MPINEILIVLLLGAIIYAILAHRISKQLSKSLYELRDSMDNEIHQSVATVRESLLLSDAELSHARVELNKKAEMIDVYIDEIEKLGVEVKKQKGRAAKQATTKGQALEKWAPFINHPDIEDEWRIENWSFMGSPIDYIVWHHSLDAEKNLEMGKIIFLDVKSGQSNLSTKQRRIRDLVKAGKVEWRTIHLK